MNFNKVTPIVLKRRIRKYNIGEILTSIISFFVVLFAGCSDDLDLKTGLSDEEDGVISIEFSFPEVSQTIITRGTDSKDERKINNLVVIVFDSEGAQVLQRADINLDGINGLNDPNNAENTFSCSFNKNKAFLTATNPKIYAVANTKALNGQVDAVGDFQDEVSKSINDLKAVTAPSYQDKISGNNGLLMSGIVENNSKKYTVTMHRSAAKVTLKKLTTIPDSDFKLEWIENGKNIGYKIYNLNPGAYLTAGLSEISSESGVNKFYKQSGKTTEVEGQEIDVTISGANERDYRYDCHVSPTQVKSDNILLDDAPYLIMKANYKGQPGYYRIDICSNDGKGNKTYYDIEPNHWYEMTITKASSAGYATIEEAVAAGDASGIAVEIHDHAANIMSMISDGSHELGVTKEVIIEGKNDDSKGTNYSFIIKLYGEEYYDDKKDYTENNYTEEEKDGKVPYPNIQYAGYQLAGTKSGRDKAKISSLFTKELDVWVDEEDNWLGFITNSTNRSITLVEAEEDISGSDIEGCDNPGKRFRITLSSTATSTDSCYIHVSWLGMQRDVKVKYIKDNNPLSLVSNVELKMHDPTITSNKEYEKYIYVKNYRYFITSNGSAESLVYEFSDPGNSRNERERKLFGVSEEAMGQGISRDKGLHFPIMYGNDSNNPWWYEYKLQVSSSYLKNSSGSSNKRYTISIENGHLDVWRNLKIYKQSELESNVPINDKVQTDQTIILNIRNCLGDYGNEKGIPNDYTYAVTNLVITDHNDSDKKYKIPIYHTGFFHLDTSGKYSANGEWYPSSDDGYYYYEVVPMGATTQYWLDRNLGAKSRVMDVLDENGSSILGIDVSLCPGGKYYTPAWYDSSNSKYESPEKHLYDLDSNQANRLSPPGYRLPKQSEWDNIKTSRLFNTVQGSTGEIIYYTSYYSTKVAGNIYFPRSRYKSSDFAFYGDPYTGYYWTATQAAGTEKGEIARWLKVLSFSGSTPFYLSGSVSGSYRSVRCVASPAISVSSTDNVISFNVKGATHVYLYDKSTKIALFSWPGKAVGNATTMMNNTVNFSYNSSKPESSLYVIFNFLTDDGKIITLCSNGEDASGGYKTATNMEPAECKGWDVENGFIYSFDVNPSNGNYKVNFTKSVQP